MTYKYQMIYNLEICPKTVMDRTYWILPSLGFIHSSQSLICGRSPKLETHILLSISELDVCPIPVSKL